MKPKSQETGKDFGKAMKTFEQQPAKTKELAILGDQAEKATGEEGAALNKMIRDKSKQEAPPPRLTQGRGMAPKGEAGRRDRRPV